MTSMRVLAGLLLSLAAAEPAYSADTPEVPDFSGWWARKTFGFERPESGIGPIGRYSNRPNQGGDFNHPNLKPEAAAVVKARGEVLRNGGNYPNPSLNCYPMVSPYIFRVQEMQVLQKKDEVVFLFMQDHQVRRVRLNAQHPADLKPSWSGDAIGHYEGDTLVVDTIGYKLGPHPVLDMYGSPFSEALHVVERYRLIDYEAAKEAQERNIREAGPVATEQAAEVDESYTGKGLQIHFTVEDKNVFHQPWSGVVTWRKAVRWIENVCAENPYEYYNNAYTDIPRADTPDF